VRERWKHRTKAFAALLLSVLFLEAALHLLAPESFLRSQTPLNLGFLKWNAFRGLYLEPNHRQSGLSINAAGRRGPPLDPRRGRRIVCMGDSSTFGVWADGDSEHGYTRFDSYPALLQESLDEHGYDDWQVINAGVPGSHAGHSLRVLRREILALEPEIVTLRIGVNDHAPRLLPWFDDPENPVLRRIVYGLGYSRLFLLGLELHHRLTVDPRIVGRIMPPESFRAALEFLVDESRKQGFHLLLIDYPLRRADPSDETATKAARFYGEMDVSAFITVHDEYQRIVADVARKSDVPLLITAPTLNDERAPGFHGDLIHPDARGMAQTAGLLFDALEHEGWLQ